MPQRPAAIFFSAPGTCAPCCLLRRALCSTAHLNGRGGLLLYLRDALGRLLHRLLDFLIFRGNAPEISQTLIHELTHFFPGLWGNEQADPHSQEYSIYKFTHHSNHFFLDVCIEKASSNTFVRLHAGCAKVKGCYGLDQLSESNDIICLQVSKAASFFINI